MLGWCIGFLIMETTFLISFRQLLINGLGSLINGLGSLINAKATLINGDMLNDGGRDIYRGAIEKNIRDGRISKRLSQPDQTYAGQTQLRLHKLVNQIGSLIFGVVLILLKIKDLERLIHFYKLIKHLILKMEGSKRLQKAAFKERDQEANEA